jgi:hypothetical protein
MRPQGRNTGVIPVSESKTKIHMKNKKLFDRLNRKYYTGYFQFISWPDFLLMQYEKTHNSDIYELWVSESIN